MRNEIEITRRGDLITSDIVDTVNIKKARLYQLKSNAILLKLRIAPTTFTGPKSGDFLLFLHLIF